MCWMETYLTDKGNVWTSLWRFFVGLLRPKRAHRCPQISVPGFADVQSRAKVLYYHYCYHKLIMKTDVWSVLLVWSVQAHVRKVIHNRKASETVDNLHRRYKVIPRSSQTWQASPSTLNVSRRERSHQSILILTTICQASPLQINMHPVSDGGNSLLRYSNLMSFFCNQ